MGPNRTLKVAILFVVGWGVLVEGASQSPQATLPAPTRIRWTHSYSEAMVTAAQSRQGVFVSFGASWCGWCERMHGEVFPDPRIVAELEPLVCVEVDIDRDTNVALEFGVRSVPRFLVINKHGEIIVDRLGYVNADDLLAILKETAEYMDVAAGTKLAPLIQGGKPDAAESVPNVDPDQTDELISLLGHKTPRFRAKAVEILTAKGSSILPTMLAALEHDYLGVRIAAWKVVRALKATGLPYDPWATRPLRREAVQQIRAEISSRAEARPQSDS